MEASERQLRNAIHGYFNEPTPDTEAAARVLLYGEPEPVAEVLQIEEA